MIRYKSKQEIEKMQVVGGIVGSILDELEQKVRPGQSTWELDQEAEKLCQKFKVKPAFKGYQGFPGCLCVSINHEVVHGIPKKKRILKQGDLVSLDFGVIWEGWYGDSARTVMVGKVSSEAKKLVEVTQKSLQVGIEQCQIGKTLGDLGGAIEKYVESFGFYVVKTFVGHGIGHALHEDPAVPNYGRAGEGMVFKEGLVIAIEPMVNIGTDVVKILSDGWTVVTEDRSLSAHFEHTIAITADGPQILTVASSGNAL